MAAIKRKPRDELSLLQEQVRREIQERHELEQELQRLEEVSRQSRAKLDAMIQEQQQQQQTKSPTSAFLLSASFLAASNAVLRSGLFSVLHDQQKSMLDVNLTIPGSKSSMTTSPDLTDDERAQVEYVLNSIHGQYKHAITRNPFTPLTSDVAQLTSDWKLSCSEQSHAESVMEDVADALQANRAIHAECEAKFKYEADLDIADAMENYGFAHLPTNHSYAFDDEDCAENIVMDNSVNAKTSIKCATLNKLVERVTHEKYVDLNTRYVFLLTYHSFTTPSELLNLLAARYDVPIPPNLTHDEIQLFKATKVDRIQIRVCSVLKNWLDEHYSDFADDDVLKQQLHKLIENMLETSASVLSTQLAKGLLALLKKKEKMGTIKRVVGPVNAPKPIISSKVTLETFSLDSASELELARQLTLLDVEKFRSIQPRECLNQAWSKANKETLAPNIIAMIDQFNKISVWVQLTILSIEDISKRATMFKKFIKIADACRELHNFNSLFAIYCGLTANPTHRLKKTKELLGAKASKLFAEFQEIFKPDKNSRNFRKLLQTTLTPCIPHLGIFLSDLTFTEDGNPDQLLGMINFQKRCKLAERIRWIKQYQQEGYNLEPVAVIREYFEKTFKIVDPETLWKMSKEVEPS